jgi:uncharacterized protein with ATP-grasp and redox domains
MRTFLDCIPCQLRQTLQAVRQISSDEELAEKVLRSVLEIASRVNYSEAPALIGRKIHAEIRRITDDPDPYKAIKQKANETARKLAPDFRKEIAASRNPFQLAVRYAIAGNILDFALYSGWNDDRFQVSLHNARIKQLNQRNMEKLHQKVLNARTILYLADNAGETVFDSLLLEQLGSADIFYAVKGSPVINDALREDALFAGIDKYATIIDNGTDCAGTALRFCSEEFKAVFASADLVIAKGQANYETLCDADREVYFLTQIKCPIIARDLRGAIGDWVITATGEDKNRNKEKE